MVNKSEKILSSFSQLFFYKELIINDLKYTPQGETEVELADLIINLKDVLLAIQLKERNACDQTGDIKIEEKWLERKCKNAKAQIKTTISEIKSGRLPNFKNIRGQQILISSTAKIIPLVIFMNETIKDYDHVLRRHTETGMEINCISFEDFCSVCKQLITPMEIIDYLEWREDFFRSNPRVDFLMYEDENGVSFSRPMHLEASAGTYLHIKYGIEQLQEDTGYLHMFKSFLHNLPRNTIMETEENATTEIICFFASLTRIEIKGIVERINTALQYKNGIKTEICGTIRNSLYKYAIFIVASINGEFFPTETLYELVNRTADVKTIMEIIIYWISDNEYRIDFAYRNIRL